MHSFLNNIAEAYINGKNPESYTFVFPNVRSKRYFAERLIKSGVPERQAYNRCITLTQLTELGSGLRRVSSLRLLFLLYRAYCDVCKSLGVRAPKVQEFDRFRFWGQRILQDFNDVDHYMASPDEIFRNAADYKKIQALYLTDEQKSIIEQYWGDDLYWSGVAAGKEADKLPLWSHIDENGEPQKKFTQLWAILGPLYHRFHELLNGESYPGMAAKAVAQKLKRGEELKLFRPDNFVFIGFNRLTTAETIIFEELDKRGKAHFYWDYDAPLMRHLGNNPANRFIGKYVERFTACNPDVKPPVRPKAHLVDVIGVPSAVGQAKVMAELIQGEETAVVLPEEEMLLPTVASIPPQYKDINVTMGYPMRFTAISQLFSQLVTLQLRAMQNHDDTLIFRDDVRAIITNPLVQAAFNEQCRWVDDFMRNESLYNLPASRLSDPGFGPLATLLRPVAPDATIAEMAVYVDDVVNLAKSSNMVNKIDRECCEVIKKMTQQIVDLTDECGLEMHKATFFNIIERTLFQRTMPLEGQNFEALQIMGVLETRALGFPRVVMLSMTDAIFPGRDNSPSFIPETLRHAYGLPTRDHSDVDAAYHFYHILSSAEHLTLIYDARVEGLTSGEMSRYIHQLRHLDFPGVTIKLHLASFGGTLTADKPILVPPSLELHKTDRVMAKLLCYRNPDSLRSSSLSASALKEYIHCPMGFYFNRVERSCPGESNTENFNAAEFGNVFHEAADRIYSRLKKVNGGTISAEMLTQLLDGGLGDMLNRELNRAINLCRNRFPAEIDGEDNPALFTTEIVGEAAIYRPTFLKQLRRLFTLDRETTPFEIIDTELSKTFSWPVAPGLDVNFTMKIDRIDSIVDANGNKIIRLIDYKTGSDATSFRDIDSLFEFCNPEHPQAIFQLFTYCAAYAYYYGVDPAMLRPQVFSLKDPSITEFPLITHGLKEVTSYGDYHAEFCQKLGEMFAGLFDQDKPFVRSHDKRSCTYCKSYPRCNAEDKPYKR